MPQYREAVLQARHGPMPRKQWQYDLYCLIWVPTGYPNEHRERERMKKAFLVSHCPL